MAVSLEKFVERLEVSGLLPADEVSASIDALPEDRRPKDVKSLAKHLVNQGKLTKYQAAAVYQQQTDHLVLGDYVVLDKLGEGGMGQVLKAQHRRMDRIVALKILPAAKVDSKSAISRFHQEVRAAAKLTHPNIVTAYDAGDQGGVHYLVMEYVDGHDLSAVVKQQGQLPVEQAIDYIIQAAQGLGYAHDKGVVHRDIKPGNLLVAVSDQRSAIGSKSAIRKSQTEIVKILDMGLARLTSGDLNKAGGEAEGLTQSGQVMGTVDYMAPEQALDTRRADHRADIYALGCTMYRLLTGEVPFAGDTMMMKLLAHREQPVPSLREFRPEVSPALEAVYQRMMAKNPDDRQQSMAEVVEQLQAALVSRAAPARARPAAPPAPALPAEEPPADSALASFLQTADKPAAPTAKAAGTTAKKKKKKGSATAFEETIDRSSSDEGTGDRLGEAQPLVPAPALAAESGTQPRPVSATSRDNKKPWLIPAIAGGGLLAVLLIGLGLYALLFSSEDVVQLADDQTPGVTNQTSDDDAIPAPGASTANPPTRPPSSSPAATPPQSRTPEKSITPADGWVDLLPMIDLSNESHIAIPTWTRTPKGLKSQFTNKKNVTLNSLVFPQGDYDVRFRFVHLSGANLVLICCPVQRLSVNFALGSGGNALSGFALIRGKGLGNENPTTRPFRLEDRQDYLVNLSVRTQNEHATLKAHVNGVEITSWEGPVSALHRLSGGRDFVIVSFGLETEFNEFSLRMVTGRATLPTPKEPSPPNYGPGAPPLAVAPFDVAQAKSHQKEWADYLGLTVEREITLPGGEKLTMVLIPPGEFLVGSTDEEQARFLEEAEAAKDQWAIDRIPSEGPQHPVRITKRFYLGKYEVTQAQWQSVMGGNPSSFKENPSHPVEQVSWEDIQPFLAKLNDNSSAAGMEFILPTEAQWEYACRSGTTTPYYGGAGENDLREYGWFKENSGGKTHPVGELRANGFGLYDMHGNVREWCADWYAVDSYAKSPVEDPTGSSAGSSRVRRGGGWNNHPGYCRSANRNDYSPEGRSSSLGFRVAMTIPDSVWQDKTKAVAAGSNFALQFEKEGFVNFADEAFGYDGTHPLTLECWLNLGGELSGWNGNFSLFGPGANLALQVHPISGTPRWHFYAGGGTNNRGFVNQAAHIREPIEDYVHVAMTYDGQSVAFFLDGKLVRESPYEFARKIGPPHDYLIRLSWNPFDGVADAERPDFRVAYDAVRISRSARYDGDFTPQRTFTPDRDTIAIYDFNEGGGTVVNDSSGNGHHGTIHGAKWVKVGVEGGNRKSESDAITPADGWIDLMPMIVPAADGFVNLDVANAFIGPWVKSEQGITSSASDAELLLLPVKVSGSYELRAEYQGKSAIFLLPVGEDGVQLIAGEGQQASGLNAVDGKLAGDAANPTSGRSIATAHQVHDLRVRVSLDGEKAGITAWLDDQQFVDWQGATTQLAYSRWWANGTTDSRPGIGVSGGRITYSNIQFQILDGVATALRGVTDVNPVGEEAVSDRDDRRISPKDQWVDLLPLTDVARDTIDGDWKRAADAIEVTGSDDMHARLMLPVVPKGSYALEIGFTRTKGTDDVAVLLPVADRSVVFFTSAFGRWSGINVIGGAKVHEPNNPTRQPTPVVTGTPIKVQVAVMLLDEANVRFVIQAGDTDRIDVTVPISDLDKGAKWKWHDGVIDTSRLGLGAEEVDATIDSIKLKALPGGEAEILDSDRESVGIEQAPPTESQPSEPDDDQRWITLFNGRDLTGWQAIGDAKLWSVSRGTLVTNGAGVGWLSTDKEFADFVLQFEFQLPANGNSGVFLRVPRAGAINGGEFLEIALQDDTAPRATKNFAGSAYNIAERKVAGAMHPVGSGKWNLMEIRAVGRAIQVALNGELVNEFDLGSVQIPAPMAANAVRQSGYIGLQCNRTGAAFRNIRIRPVE